MQFTKINISIPEKLLKQADKLAQKEFRNRSELIREAVRIYITNKNIASEEDDVKSSMMRAGVAFGVYDDEEVKNWNENKVKPFDLKKYVQDSSR